MSRAEQSTAMLRKKLVNGGGGGNFSHSQAITSRIYRARFRKPSGVAIARRRLQQRLLELGYPSTCIQRVVVATAEAMINAVRYAGGGELDVVSSDSRLHAVITDSGPGIAFDRLAQALLRPRNRWNLGRGHGYWLMVSMASHCRVTSTPGRTCVELVFDVGT